MNSRDSIGRWKVLKEEAYDDGYGFGDDRDNHGLVEEEIWAILALSLYAGRDSNDTPSEGQSR